MPEKRNRVLSCIQPTAESHLGNYFGAIVNWAQLQDRFDCVYGVVDLHAITMPYSPGRLRDNTRNMLIDLIACGIDPDKSILFLQSLVPEHAELAWLLGCLCPYGDLKRMTQFKEKAEQIESARSTYFVSVGLFTYPVLQAADILIYRANQVPVGSDQEQHLELSREIARRFNTTFGELFPEPQPLFTPSPKIMSLADPTKKMSKSLGDKHCIGIFEDEDSIRQKVKTAVTDSGVLPPGMEVSPGVGNMLTLLKACRKDKTAEDMMLAYRAGNLMYRDLKAETAEALVELTNRLKKRRGEVESQYPDIFAKIRETSDAAREIARDTLKKARELMGLPGRWQGIKDKG